MRKVIYWILLNLVPPAIGVGILVLVLTAGPPSELYAIDVLARSTDPGKIITIRYTGKVNRLCPVVSSEELVGNGLAIPLRIRIPSPSDRQAPGDFKREVEVIIPEEVPNGVYKIRSIASFGSDWWHLCFRSRTLGPPDRPESNFFWVGPPQWGMNNRSSR